MTEVFIVTSRYGYEDSYEIHGVFSSIDRALEAFDRDDWEVWWKAGPSDHRSVPLRPGDSLPDGWTSIGADSHEPHLAIEPWKVDAEAQVASR